MSKIKSEDKKQTGKKMYFSKIGSSLMALIYKVLLYINEKFDKYQEVTIHIGEKIQIANYILTNFQPHQWMQSWVTEI